nr:hypothetical protein [Tanacetum cinerariifolium]GEX43638.1 hypothetical protein [Tanacetum cinerariifolium]
MCGVLFEVTGERPKEWVQWLPLAEYGYNTNKHSSINVTPYELCKGTDLKIGILPHCGKHGLLAVEPEAILDRRMAKLNNRAAVYVLIKWVNHSEEDATWELYEDLVLRFPEFPIDP